MQPGNVFYFTAEITVSKEGINDGRSSQFTVQSSNSDIIAVYEVQACRVSCCRDACIVLK